MSCGCTGNCISNCNYCCDQSCTSTCRGSGNTICGCTGNCWSECGYSCYKSCSGGCNTVCNGMCDDGCNSGCYTGCYTSCSSCGGCDGGCYSGCYTGCTTSCRGYCDNACSSTSAPDVIANIGLNIRNHGVVLKGDFLNLKTALRNEFTRRSLTLPTDDTYTITPANGVVILKEQALKVFSDAKKLDSSKNFTINPDMIVKTSDFTATIAYIQSLMAQKVQG